MKADLLEGKSMNQATKEGEKWILIKTLTEPQNLPPPFDSPENL